MKFFKENPPKAVFWIGFVIVALVLLGGLGYFAYLVSNEKPEVKEPPKKDIYREVYTNVEAGRTHVAVDGVIVAITDDLLTVNVKSKNTQYKIAPQTVFVTGESQTTGSKSDLKVGSSISFTYNLNNDTLVNVNF